MNRREPSVVVLAGPNGSGKTTTAPALLRDTLKVMEYVNADVLAQGLSGFAAASAAMEAGEIMLRRLHELAARRADFAFETTLASRLLAPWLAGLVREGYWFHLVFLWLSSPELAVQRVADRVRMGGHDVPEATVRRRYWAGLRNFFELYQPLATTWLVYDNNYGYSPQPIATGEGRVILEINDERRWDEFSQSGRRGREGP